MTPLVGRNSSECVRRILQDVVFSIRRARLYLSYLLADRDHRIAESVELGFDSLSVGSTINVPPRGTRRSGHEKP
jgi:hypothetical protein